MNEAFQVNTLSHEGKQRAEAIAERFDSLLCDLRVWVPDGREFDIVETLLETACFFAKKAMAKVNTA